MKDATVKRRSARDGLRDKTARGDRRAADRLRRLSETIGEKRLLSVLETLERYFDSTRRAAREELKPTGDLNAIRLKTLRALIFHDTLSSDEVRGYVNRSRPVINRMAKQGQLLALSKGRALRFPAWQFDASSETGILPHLTEVLEVMDASPFRKAAWFVTENPNLRNRVPLDLLRAGEVDALLREAKSLVGS